jgi:hypothetical protein
MNPQNPVVTFELLLIMIDGKNRHQLIHRIGIYGGGGADAPADRSARSARDWPGRRP